MPDVVMRGHRFGTRHLGPFVLEVESADGADFYELALVDGTGVRVGARSSDVAFDLSPYWDQLADGYVRYRVAAHQGGVQRRLGGGRFLKAKSPLAGRVPPASSWEEASHLHYGYLAGLQAQAEPDVPTWLNHAWIDVETGKLAPVAYPGLHYPFHIWSLLRYTQLSPDARHVTDELLTTLVEHTLSHRTPPTWHWPNYPPSTIGHDRSVEADETVQPLKAALLAAALLDLPAGSSRPAAVELALDTAEQLAMHQRGDGALPFRVNARTGEWESGESSAIVFAIDLWKRLERSLGTTKFADAERRAMRWLLRGPVTSRKWLGNYEDIGTSRTDTDSGNLNNFDAAMTALYLVEQQEGDRDSLQRAEAIERWILDEFVFAEAAPPVSALSFVGPAVMEQSEHFYPIDFHAANLARLEWALYRRTGLRRHRDLAEALLDGLTHYLDPRGRPLTYAPDPDLGYGYSAHIWFGCAAASWLALTEGALHRRHETTDDPTLGGSR